MLSIKHIFTAIAVITLSACSGSDGDKFVGKWINGYNPKTTLEIVKDSNGKTFTITDRMIFRGEPSVAVYHATEEHGNLVIQSVIGKLYLKIDANDSLKAPLGRSCPGCENWARAK